MKLTAKAAARFTRRIDKSGDCWTWTGTRTHSGYGHFKIGQKNVRAHRIAWAQANGDIPAGMCVLHKCDVRACVKPDHLFIGTQIENIADRERKGRGNMGPAITARRRKQ